MKKTILITSLLFLLLACKPEKSSKTVDPDTSESVKVEYNESMENQSDELEDAVDTNDIPLDNNFEPEEPVEYTYESFKEEFSRAFNTALVPIGTYFWEEFEDIETQYELTEDESKLLGVWMDVTFMTDDSNNYYVFYPNKLFLLFFKYMNYHISDKYIFLHALGTWDIVNGTVQITVNAIITGHIDYPNLRGIIFVDHPYTVDFINIDDIGEEGYTKRPINDTILSEELEQKVIIKEPNKTNNMYVRNIYTIHVITNSGRPEKYYGFLKTVREMAQDNHSGHDIVAKRELIVRYIYNLL